MKSIFAIATLALIATSQKAWSGIDVNFDGKLAPQTMHDIFSESHQILPSGLLTDIPEVQNPSKGEALPAINSNWDHCYQQEVLPGLVIPICPVAGGAEAAIPPAVLRIASDGLKESCAVYTAEHPDKAELLRAALEDKKVAVMFNGKRFSLAEKKTEGTRLTWQDGVNIVNAGAAAIDAVFEAADNVVPAAVENYYAHQYNNPNESNNGGSGSTYHSQSGNGSYDVNRSK